MSFLAGGPLLARTPPPSIHRMRPSVAPMRALSAGSPSPSPMASQVVRLPRMHALRCCSIRSKHDTETSKEIVVLHRFQVIRRSLKAALRQSNTRRINPLVLYVIL